MSASIASGMKKELSPNLEMVACEVCGRTILKGEHVEPYLVPDGSRRMVCELCTRRAEGAGWLRESAHAEMPSPFPPTEPRRGLLTRLRRRRPENGPGPEAGDRSESRTAWEEEPQRFEAAGGPAAEHAPASGSLEAPGFSSRAAEEGAAGQVQGETAPAVPAPAPHETASHGSEEEPAAHYEGSSPSHGEVPAPVADDEGFAERRAADERARRRDRRSRRRLRDPRHVRAVPTNDEVKVERALELFNGSEFQRTTAGLMRTLGEPWVSARAHADSASEVTIVVAWELSWYQYRVDLGDANEAVALVDKGQEIDELDASLREWNAAARSDGVLETAASAA